MNGTKRTIAAIVCGVSVARAFDTMMKSVEDGGVLFGVGRVLADVSVGLVGTGLCLKTFDAIEQTGKNMLKMIADKAAEAEEVEDQFDIEFDEVEDEEDQNGN